MNKSATAAETAAETAAYWVKKYEEVIDDGLDKS